jgi:hypothetical protein
VVLLGGSDDVSNLGYRRSPLSSSSRLCGMWECSAVRIGGRLRAAALILPAPTVGVTMDFGRRSYCRTVNEKGRAYQYQAMELIKVCNVFSKFSEASSSSC